MAGRTRNPDTESIVFAGVAYTRRPGKRYFKTNRWDREAKRYYPDSLHRAIWRSHHGVIPAGHDIHHRDGDWNNNAIDNLECVSRAVHNRKHDSFAGWNATPEAEEQRKRNRQKCWTDRPWHRKECVVCGAEFQTRHVDPGRVKYCSRKCNNRHQAGRIDPGLRPGS